MDLFSEKDSGCLSDSIIYESADGHLSNEESTNSHLTQFGENNGPLPGEMEVAFVDTVQNPIELYASTEECFEIEMITGDEHGEQTKADTLNVHTDGRCNEDRGSCSVKEPEIVTVGNERLSLTELPHIFQVEHSNHTPLEVTSIDVCSNSSALQQVFDEVKATLSGTYINSIPEKLEDFFEKLKKETGVEFKCLKSDGNQYAIVGNWNQVTLAKQRLEKILSTPFRELNQNMELKGQTNVRRGSLVDKGVTCDIIKVGNLTRFAEEHPRQARFSSVVFQRAHFPISRQIRDKYKVKRATYKSRKMPMRGSTKNLNQSSTVIQSKHEAEDSIRSDCMETTVIDDADTNDVTDTENVEPFMSKNIGEVLGRPKPKKNYEELTPFKFFCKMCSFKTKRESHYHKHLAIHEKVTTLHKCDQCSFTSIRLSHLRRHEMTHSQNTIMCEHCNYKTDDMKLLVRHVKIKHERDDDLQPKDVLRCSECSYKTTKPYHFQRHMRVHNGIIKGSSQLFQCNQCSYKTSRKEHYIRHVNNVHSNKRPYLCDFCGKAFKRTDALKQHRVTHSTVDPQGVQFRCPVCEKTCRSHAHLTEHQAVHSNVRSFLCEICGASFKTRSVQRKHVLTIHKNPRSYSCQHCNKRFNTNYALRRHVRLHETGVELGRSSPSLGVEEEVTDLVNTVSNTSATNTNTAAASIQNLILLPASAARGAASSSTATTIPITIHSGVGGGQATIQLAASVLQGAEPLVSSERASVVTMQDCGENSRNDEGRSQTFIQTNEATTALLYLTTNFPSF